MISADFRSAQQRALPEDHRLANEGFLLCKRPGNALDVGRSRGRRSSRFILAWVFLLPTSGSALTGGSGLGEQVTGLSWGCSMRRTMTPFQSPQRDPRQDPERSSRYGEWP